MAENLRVVDADIEVAEDEHVDGQHGCAEAGFRPRTPEPPDNDGDETYPCRERQQRDEPSAGHLIAEQASDGRDDVEGERWIVGEEQRRRIGIERTAGGDIRGVIRVPAFVEVERNGTRNQQPRADEGQQADRAERENEPHHGIDPS